MATYDRNLSLAELRESYQRATLSEQDTADDPFEQFQRWFDEARQSGLREPNAMTLASVSAQGQPSARIVLLKAVSAEGFVFFTNYESRKAQELEQNPRVALLFYWAELERQVRIEGTVSRVSREESRAYFHRRPKGSQLGALASRQSEPVPGRDVLDRRLAELEVQYANEALIPLPDFWGGYRATPAGFEFWQGRPNRLHDRISYLRGENTWRKMRLSP